MFHTMSEQLTVDSALQSDLKEWKQNQNGLDIQIYIKVSNIWYYPEVLPSKLALQRVDPMDNTAA